MLKFTKEQFSHFDEISRPNQQRHFDLGLKSKEVFGTHEISNRLEPHSALQFSYPGLQKLNTDSREMKYFLETPKASERMEVERDCCIERCKRSWVEILFLDSNDCGVAFAMWKLGFPSGRLISGKLNEYGFCRIDNINEHGPCTIEFPEYDFRCVTYVKFLD